jgi:hypothetical protein
VNNTRKKERKSVDKNESSKKIDEVSIGEFFSLE